MYESSIRAVARNADDTRLTTSTGQDDGGHGDGPAANERVESGLVGTSNKSTRVVTTNQRKPPCRSEVPGVEKRPVLGRPGRVLVGDTVSFGDRRASPHS